MKNKFKTTINTVVDKAREIAEKVGDATETVVENVVETVDAVTETINTVKETASSVTDAIDQMPSVNDVMQAMVKDARVGHFLVDVLTGMNVNEASALHFPAENAEKAIYEESIDSLLTEAEQRGYLRGRNEQIEVKMQEPLHWQSRKPERKPVIETTILNHPRRSVWED